MADTKWVVQLSCPAAEICFSQAMKHDRACVLSRRHRPHMALVPPENSQPAWLLQEEMLFHILQCDKRHPSNQLSWQFVPCCQYTSLYLTPNQFAACHFLSSRYSHLLTLEVLIWIKNLSQVSKPFQICILSLLQFSKIHVFGRNLEIQKLADFLTSMSIQT